MSAHTPGLWFVDEDLREGMEHNKHICSGPDTRICFMAHSAGRNPEQDEANARLIAAAPDLLEALQAAVAVGIVPVSSAKDGGASTYSAQVLVADQIRAAIAKAIGTKE